MLNMLNNSKRQYELERIIMNLLDSHFVLCILDSHFIFYIVDNLTYQGVSKLDFGVLRMPPDVASIFLNRT